MWGGRHTGDLCLIVGSGAGVRSNVGGLVAECGVSLRNSGQLSVAVRDFRRVGITKLLLSVGSDLRLFSCPRFWRRDGGHRGKKQV